MIKKYLGDLFIKQRFFVAVGLSIFLFILAFYIPFMERIAEALFSVFILLCLMDYSLLFFAL